MRTFVPVLVALGALLLVGFLAPGGGLPLPQARAGEDGGGKGPPGKQDPGKGDGTEPGADLGDKHVAFADQVNKAIEEGVNWLLARPAVFRDRKYEYAHWGLISSPVLYGGGTGPGYTHPAGPTALALYTLLKCGVSPKHPVVREGMNWLREEHTITKQYDGVDGHGFTWRHTEAGSSYELSAMILALTAVYDHFKKTSRSRAAAAHHKLKIRNRADREWLIEMVQDLIDRRGKPMDDPKPADRLGWRYNVPEVKRGGGRGHAGWNRQGNKHIVNANQDLSSTQLATMALYSAQRFGIKVPVQVWKDVLKFTLDHQEKSGPEVERFVPGYKDSRYGGPPKDHARGFMYIPGSPDGSEGRATGSMTACGVTNLLICREMLAKDHKTRREFVDSGQLKQVDTAIWDGLAWMDRNWSPFTNPRSRYGYHIYYLYCVERAMDIMGHRLLGKRLWYPLGAKEILKRQRHAKVQVPKEKGKGTEERPGVFWNTNATHDPKDVLDTCFALLYLKRATQGLAPPPAVVTKGG